MRIENYYSGFAGANAGEGEAPAFSHVLFESNYNLKTTPPVPSAAGVESLFESNMEEAAATRVHPVGVLPDGAIAAARLLRRRLLPAGASSLTGDWHNQPVIEHVISADGSHVVFEAAADGGKPDKAQKAITEVYDRVNGTSTIELSAPAPGAKPANPAPEPAQFWAASADGTYVFFTSKAELTTASNTGSSNQGEDLYRYDTATETLTDLSADPAPGGAEVLGMVGASEDGSYAYFVAKGKLPGAGAGPEEGPEATAGEPNLYVSHEGTVSFIATLSEADSRDWSSAIYYGGAYLTPDGRHLAFVSVNSEAIDGYDNHDQKTGEPDEEVYEYGAEPATLACASCDPTGARPLGNSSINTGSSPNSTLRTPFYKPRVMSDDGSRIFFHSFDPLVSGAGGLLEYEGGKVHRIAPEGAALLDASASGKDVFFTSGQQLSQADHDELLDIYDARAEGGFPAPAPLPLCEAAGVFGIGHLTATRPHPVDPSFNGNEEGPKHPRCGKGQVKRAGRCVSRKHHKARQHHKAKKRNANAKRRSRQVTDGRSRGALSAGPPPSGVVLRTWLQAPCHSAPPRPRLPSNSKTSKRA